MDFETSNWKIIFSQLKSVLSNLKDILFIELTSCFYLFIGAYIIGSYYEPVWEHLQDIMQKKKTFLG